MEQLALYSDGKTRGVVATAQDDEKKKRIKEMQEASGEK